MYHNRVNWDSFYDILIASIKQETHETHKNRYEVFIRWLDLHRANGNQIAHIKQLKKGKEFTTLSNNVADYFEFVFNMTHNTGDTLNKYLDSFLYMWQLHGIGIKRTDFPWISRFVKGCNKLAQNKYGKRVRRMKYAICNPQLEHMLAITKDDHARMGMLFQHRFCLRAEHYTHRKSKKKDCLRMRDMLFYPSFDNPYSLLISVPEKIDKNHQYLAPMTRQVHCTCEYTWIKWTCIVHTFKAYVLKYNKYTQPDAPVIGSNKKAVTYSKMRLAVRKVVQQLGLKKVNYGTHSLRAGSATELHCEGRDIMYIKHFGNWANVESAMGYLRPRNADMNKFIPDWDDYCLRREEQLKQFVQAQFNRLRKLYPKL